MPIQGRRIMDAPVTGQREKEGNPASCASARGRGERKKGKVLILPGKKMNCQLKGQEVVYFRGGEKKMGALLPDEGEEKKKKKGNCQYCYEKREKPDVSTFRSKKRSVDSFLNGRVKKKLILEGKEKRKKKNLLSNAS